MKEMNHAQALKFCSKLNYAGHNDWRLPNAIEMESLIDTNRFNLALPQKHPFKNLHNHSYWSSKVHRTGFVLCYTLLNGQANYRYGAALHQFIPVRGGNFDPVGNLIISTLAKGRTRLKDNKDGTITDNRTGLVWIKDLNSL